MSFMCFFSIISIVPATVELAKQYHVTEPTAVYLGSTPTLIYAVAPFLYAPISHMVGRRSVMLVSSFFAIVFSIGVALSHTYTSTLVLREFQGFGACASLSLAPAAISDMFFTHERGRSLGIYVLFLVTSPFIGGVIGGAIDSRLGWQWSQWISAIGYGLCWVLHYLFVPETIYVRGSPSTSTGALAKAFKIQIPPSSARHGFFYNFSRPFIMFSYPACIMPCLWFSLSYSCQVVITANFPVVFKKPPFDFNTLQVGFCSFSGLIGAVIGECFAGPVIDLISRRQLSGGKKFQPEMRLHALWPGLVAVPVGYVVFGTKIQFVTGWAPPLVGVGVFLFGQEILTTVIQTYLVECFPQQAAEVSLVFNFWRNVQVRCYSHDRVADSGILAAFLYDCLDSKGRRWPSFWCICHSYRRHVPYPDGSANVARQAYSGMVRHTKFHPSNLREIYVI